MVEREVPREKSHATHDSQRSGIIPKEDILLKARK
jgi:hypothetical protein